MGNLAITAAQVNEGTGPNQLLNGIMGGAGGAAGETVYLDTASNKWLLEDADIDTSAAISGMLLNTAANGQPCTVQTDGGVTVGADAGIVEATVYVQSPTDGKICPADDALMTTGKYMKVVGVGTGNDQLKIHPQSTDEQIPA